MGLDINHEDKNGSTALHIAVRNNNLAATNLLIGMGSDVNHRDKEGFTALNIAIQQSQPDIVQLLGNHKAVAYFDGEVESAAFIMKEIEEKRKLEKEKAAAARAKAAPEIIWYWKEFIRLYELPLDCEFRLLGGDGMRKTTSVENTSAAYFWTNMDAFVFGGCSKADYFHYRIYDSNDNVYQEGINLSWKNHTDPIVDENGKVMSILFETSFNGRIIWYASNHKIENWEQGEVLLSKIKEYQLYVQE